MLKKCIIIILIILLALTYLSNKTYAMDNIISGGDNFLAAAGNTSVIDEKELSKTSEYIYNILFTIAVVLAFAIGMVIGIQFIIGGVAEQAKIKETLVPYVIGVFIVFAAFTIWKIAVNIGNSIENTEKQTISEDEANNNYNEVMNVTLSQIDKMTYDERLKYYEKVLLAIKEQTAFNNDEKLNNLNERKKYVEEKNATTSPQYGLWNEYKNDKTDEEAYLQMINTNLNSIKTTSEIELFMRQILNAQNYFKYYEDTEKINELQKLYNKTHERYQYIRMQEASGEEVEDTVLKTENRIEKNGYYVEIIETGRFEKIGEGIYTDTSTNTHITIDVKVENPEDYLNSKTSNSATDITTNTIMVNGKEIQYKKLRYNEFVEYYICYQIDDDNIYTIELDSDEMDEETLLKNITEFLKPNIGRTT